MIRYFNGFFRFNPGRVDSYYSMYYIALLEYKEMLNEIFSQGHEGPFRSESGKDH